MKKLILILTILLSACAKVNKGFNFIILVDQSKSFTPFFSKYTNSIDKVVNAIGFYDTVSIISINSFSEIEPAVLSKYKFKLPPEIDPFIDQQDNYFLKEKIDSILNVQRKFLKEKIIEMLNAEGTNYTDIFGALKIAEKLLVNNTKNIIIIFSDMLNESHNLNFRKINLTDSKINDIITSLKSKDYIPDLTGSDVYVIGIRADNPTRLKQVEKFWRLYFSYANANLKNYSADLLVGIR
jgi:hypothetical protein